MGLIHYLSFLAINFQPKCLGKFLETGDYFLRILVAVCREDSVNKYELAYQNIYGFSC